MSQCNTCNEYGLQFNRKYSPCQYFEGNRNSIIWVVGLNPKGNNKIIDGRSTEQLAEYFDGDELHNYFRDFNVVSEKIYDLFGKEGGACHTDIVKCYSERFPPEGLNGAAKNEIINNCKEHFQKQLEGREPKVIICNGIDVCNFIKQLIKPVKDYETYYQGRYNNKEIIVVLSGFIGRIDNYSKKDWVKKSREF